MRKRRICVITGSRAEYGLLKLVMKSIQESEAFELQLIATGMHFSTQQNFTVAEIRKDGFKIDVEVNLDSEGGSSTEIATYSGRAVEKVANALDYLQPDLVLLLGDRFEILSSAFAALIQRIPVGHINGGELTEGAIDDSMRHAISKMASLHFVTTLEYQKRVIQMGEQPERVFLVGGLGAQSIRETVLIPRDELELQLKLNFKERNLLVTFHPPTLDETAPASQFAELLKALGKLKDTLIIFTFPNSDHGGFEMIEMIESFVNLNKNAFAFPSLGHLRYISTLAQVDAVVGNSSSGLVEAPSLQIGTINIGDRQNGRVMPSSMINCEPKFEDISNAIAKLYSEDFQNLLKKTKNPHDMGNTSDEIVKILERTEFQHLIQKRFYDLDLSTVRVS